MGEWETYPAVAARSSKGLATVAYVTIPIKTTMKAVMVANFRNRIMQRLKHHNGATNIAALIPTITTVINLSISLSEKFPTAAWSYIGNSGFFLSVHKWCTQNFLHLSSSLRRGVFSRGTNENISCLRTRYPSSSIAELLWFQSQFSRLWTSCQFVVGSLWISACWSINVYWDCSHDSEPHAAIFTQTIVLL